MPRLEHDRGAAPHGGPRLGAELRARCGDARLAFGGERYDAAVDPALRPEDLAPGDRGVAARDWRDVRVRRVVGADDPDFALAYERLWASSARAARWSGAS